MVQQIGRALGNVAAEFHLGICFDSGQGTAPDASQAVHWFTKAAEQNESESQYFLGEMYCMGRGVPIDFVEAYKWFNLAATQAHPGAIKRRPEVADKMTREQVAEAQRRTCEFLAKHQSQRPEQPADPNLPVIRVALPRNSGTGFFITPEGHLLTCNHLVAGASRIVVKTKKGELPAEVLLWDAANDVALLKVSGRFAALPIISSRNIKLGEPVFTIGFPNPPIQGDEPKLTRGEINSLSGVQDDPRLFQIGVAILPGNSGGPLIDQNGNAIGIVVFRLGSLSESVILQNVNYALKSSFALPLLETEPDLEKKLKASPRVKKRSFDEVVQSAQDAVASIVTY